MTSTGNGGRRRSIERDGWNRCFGTPAKIFYKYEGVSATGSHKPNTAVPQAFYNKEAGVTRLVTETGAGQWGSSLAFAGAIFGLVVDVFMVRVSYDQKPYRRALMETFGARCVPSPSPETASGRAILEARADHPGSLGIAISEAVEVAAQRDDTKYALGSVLNHVLLHQTVIGQEAIAQLHAADDYPDVVIGCTGGGSNFSGMVFPFLGAQLRGGPSVRVIAVEPAACPSLTRGRFAYDFGDTGHLTPLVKMHTLGSGFTPPGFHAGGLRYHGMAPMVSHLKELGLIEARAYHQTRCFEAGVAFARAEGILPAPEANHAVCCAIEEAERCRESGVADDPLQSLRPRPFRHAGLHRLLRRQPHRPTLRRIRARDGVGGTAGGLERLRPLQSTGGRPWLGSVLHFVPELPLNSAVRVWISPRSIHPGQSSCVYRVRCMARASPVAYGSARAARVEGELT